MHLNLYFKGCLLNLINIVLFSIMSPQFLALSKMLPLLYATITSIRKFFDVSLKYLHFKGDIFVKIVVLQSEKRPTITLLPRL